MVSFLPLPFCESSVSVKENPDKKHLLKHHLFQIESAINFYSNTYENLIILGVFNAQVSDFNMKSFYAINSFKCII